jgi:methyl-accepting chemotaxis protein
MMRTASLRLELRLGFGLLILLLSADSVGGFLSLARLNSANAAVRSAEEQDVLTLEMRSGLSQQQAGLRAVLLGQGREEMDQGRSRFQNALHTMYSVSSEAGRLQCSELSVAAEGYERLLDRIVGLHSQGESKAAVGLSAGPESQETQRSVESALEAIEQSQREIRRVALAQHAATGRQTAWLLSMLTIFGVFSGIAVASYLPRRLAGSMAGMMRLTQEIAANDLAGADLEDGGNDELGRAAKSLNAMKNNLRGLVHSMAHAAEQVASASEQISSSATQQAHAGEVQKGQATQVGVAMQEMSATVRDVSENSQRAADAARHAAETARQGGLIVEASLSTMRRIAESVSATAAKIGQLGRSSDQISRIIAVIDDIADQTNLLALNAAIEAARAGAQGRGFAVVADEVRKLAERTTSATKEVAHMVESIQGETKNAVAGMNEGTRQVQEGVETTSRAGDSLKQIIQMSEEVGEMISHIATAATQQFSATEQVNQNVEQITRLIAESAVGAEQEAKACRDLSLLALDLQNLVSSFRFDAHEALAAREPGRGRAMASPGGTKSLAAGA